MKMILAAMEQKPRTQLFVPVTLSVPVVRLEVSSMEQTGSALTFTDAVVDSAWEQFLPKKVQKILLKISS